MKNVCKTFQCKNGKNTFYKPFIVDQLSVITVMHSETN